MTYERIEYPEGQLSLLKPFPNTPLMRDVLVRRFPVDRTKGQRLENTGRDVRLHTIEGNQFVTKRMRMTDDIRDRSPSFQIRKLLELQRRYTQVYGTAFPMEQAFGFFVNWKTNERDMIFEYYNEPVFDRMKDEDIGILRWAIGVEYEYRQRLEQIGVIPSDGLDYLLIAHGSGYRHIFIDSENWMVDECY